MARPRNALSVLRRTLKKSAKDEITDLAASIAFYAFFGLFPLILAVIAVAGHLLEGAEAQRRVYDFLAEAFPASADMLRETITGVVAARGSMGIAAVLGFLWSASAGLGAASRGINRAMATEATRSVVKARARYLLMAVGVLFLVLVYVLLTSASQVMKLEVISSDVLGLEADTLPHATARAVGFVSVFLIFLLLYKGAPTCETHWREVWPGALLAAVVTEVGKVVFLFYVNEVAQLEAVFGSLSTIMVLLLWLYLSAIALLLGVEFNVVRQQAQEGYSEKAADASST